MQNGKNRILGRATVVCAILTAVFLALAARILFIQIFNYDEYERIVINQITQKTTVSAKRGEIYDRNGNVLATDITTYRLFVDPAAISRASRDNGNDYVDIVSRGLAGIESLELEYDYIKGQIADYVKYRDRTIARHLSEEQAAQVRSFIEENELEELALVHLQTTSKRYYPYSTLASHVLGFTGTDGGGLYGLEYQYNDVLSGEDGAIIRAKDTYGNDMPFDYESYIPAVDGYNVVTTIDVFIQAELEAQLEQTYKESGGENRALGIVMDVNTGAILAMAVYPNYDLNDPRELDWQSLEVLLESGYEEGSDEYDAKKQELMLKMWSNKAITDPYMPGSTFKVITSSMAYEEDLVSETEKFNCPGYYEVGGRKIKCHVHSGHGLVTYAYGLQQSCNPTLMQMGLRIGAERFYDYFKSYGYTKKTGIDLPGEATAAEPLFWYKEDFYRSRVNLAVASFGQNFKVTGIQHLTAISAVANGGSLVTPHLIKEITDQDGNVVYSYEPKMRGQVLSDGAAAKVSEVLADGVATDGGSRAAYVAGYRVAAKTGTSEKMDEVVDGVRKYICSAVSYAPYEDPVLASMILVDEPTRGNLYASTIAAPYISNLMAMALPYYGVEAEYSEDELEKMKVKTPSIPSGTWSVSFATSVAEAQGFRVEVVGDGSIVRGQSPAAGTVVDPENAVIYLYTTKEAVSSPNTVKVPSLEGLTAVAANGTLASYGLNIKISGTNNYMSGMGALAYEQYPAAGTEVPVGTVVEVAFRYPGDTEMTDIDGAG